MNPNVTTQPEFHLPEPLPPSSAGAERPLTPERGPEAMTMPAARPEAAGSRPAAPGFALPVSPLLPTAPVAQAAQSASATPATAKDDDVIEREWIDKAKQIVRATQANPYQQNKQLAAFKADYIQKRYGKTVKLSE
ncbi:MAG TPA: hypothetical protein VF261_02580 [Candidatus Saccharimonadales bacterium]